MKALAGSRGRPPLILDLGTRWRWVVTFKSPPHQSRDRTPVPTE